MPSGMGWRSARNSARGKGNVQLLRQQHFLDSLEVGQKATSEQRSILGPEKVLHYLGTQKVVFLLEGESGKTRIPYSSHSGTTHEDRKTRESQGGSFAVRSRF